MKKLGLQFPSGKYTLPVIALLVLVAVYAAIRLMQVDLPESPMKISVVVENSGSERWNKYFQGLEQAASDKNVEVSTVVTGYFSDDTTQDLLVTSEYLNGANAVITKTEPEAAAVCDIIMEEMSREYGGVIGGRKVALLLGSEYDSFSNEVGELLAKRIESAGGDILWQKNAPCSVSSILKKSKRTDIIIALDDESLTQAAAYISGKKNDKRNIIGMGCSPNAIYYLDRGVIDALLVPDDFTLGYESLLAAVDGDNFSTLSPDIKVVHPDEVYEKVNEKLLFPLSGYGAVQGTKNEITIGVVVYDEFDTFVGQLLNVFMDEISQKTVESGMKINVIREASGGSQITQNDQVNELIRKGCDVVCVNLVDRTDPAMIIEAARDADVPIIFFNRELVTQDLYSWDKLYYVGADAYNSGIIEGQMAADAFKADPTLDKNGDGIMQLVVLEGEPGHQDAIIRSEYSVSTIMDAGITVDKLESGIANWKRAEAQSKMARIIDKYGDEIEVILSNNDDMALGAIDEYEARGIAMSDRPIIVGIDGTDVGLEAVESGTLLGTVYNDKDSQGKAMVNLAFALASGGDFAMPELTDGKYIRYPYARVEHANVSDYLE